MKRTNQQRAVDRIVRDGRRRAFAQERETMSGAEIDSRITKAIADYIVRTGNVTKRDLLSTNVPASAIDAQFSHCLAEAQRLHPELAHIEAQP